MGYLYRYDHFDWDYQNKSPHDLNRNKDKTFTTYQIIVQFDFIELTNYQFGIPSSRFDDFLIERGLFETYYGLNTNSFDYFNLILRNWDSTFSTKIYYGEKAKAQKIESIVIIEFLIFY